MKAIKIKPILYKEGNFVYPLTNQSQLSQMKLSEQKKKISKRKQMRTEILKSKDSGESSS